MELLTTPSQMQAFDRAAISRFRIPGLILMENAGRAFVDMLCGAVGPLAGKRVTVVCGKGNNGGDGFVIARHLLNRGARVQVLLVARRAALSGDAATNCTALLQMRRAFPDDLSFTVINRSTRLSRMPSGAVIVDAMFGTGFAGSPHGISKRVIEWINSRGAFVSSVDVPSGVHSGTGETEGAAVHADMTVTMGASKIGLFFGEGVECSGTVRVAEISIPRTLMRPPARAMFRVGRSDIRSILPPRPRTAHKYSVGKVFVLAGSRAFTGAPALAALSALRSGAGAVVLGVPRSIHAVLARKLSEVILLSLDETEEGTLAPAAAGEISSRMAWADAVLLGPGLSRNADTDALILDAVARCTKPLVIDADGLNALGERSRVLAGRKAPTVLTPHTGELARLTGGTSGEIERTRVDAAAAAARRFRSVIVHKGAPTVTARPDGTRIVNSTGNPGMATIGTGDVLAGLISGLIAQGLGPFEGAYAGVYLHGLAGDCAAEKYGQRSLLAGDVLAHVTEALRTVEGE